MRRFLGHFLIIYSHTVLLRLYSVCSFQLNKDGGRGDLELTEGGGIHIQDVFDTAP